VRGEGFTVHGLRFAVVLVLVVVLPTSPRRLKLREAMSGRLSSIWVTGGWELVGQALAVRRDTDGTYGTHGTYGSRRFARTRDRVLNVPIEDEYDDAGLRTVNLLHCFCYLLAVFRVFHRPTQVGDFLSQRIA
jgi:hypothetical protein